MAGRPKGTIKTGGRTKGQPNKVTADIRGKIADFLDNNIDNMQKDFDAIIEPEKRLLFMEKLFSYIAPKGQHIRIDTTEKKPFILPDWNIKSKEKSN